MFVYFDGLLLGLSLIISLGPQNIFLIKQGVRKNHPVLSAVICFLCDFVLIGASITSLHELLLLRPILQIWMMLLGCLFLLYYAVKTLKNVLTSSPRTIEKTPQGHSRLQIVILSSGFSLLNPHAIIDSLVIIGGGSSAYPNQELVFLLGAITSSLLWFSSLTFTARYFSEVLTKASVWRGIELISSAIMAVIGIKLGVDGLQLLLELH